MFDNNNLKNINVIKLSLHYRHLVSTYEKKWHRHVSKKIRS